MIAALVAANVLYMTKTCSGKIVDLRTFTTVQACEEVVCIGRWNHSCEDEEAEKTRAQLQAARAIDDLTRANPKLAVTCKAFWARRDWGDRFGDRKLEAQCAPFWPATDAPDHDWPISRMEDVNGNPICQDESGAVRTWTCTPLPGEGEVSSPKLDPH